MPKYRPEVFDVANLDQAKAIILTGEVKTSTEERWQRKTPIVTDRLSRDLNVQPNHLILDYGCGVGRIAKELLTRQKCSIVGADISTSMTQLAPGYTASKSFCAMNPTMLDALVARGMRFDSAYAVWVIQHCANPQEDLNRIAKSLKSDGIFAMFNSIQRCVPTDHGWNNDRIDLIPILNELFADVRTDPVPPGITPQDRPDLAYVALCRHPRS